jgi:hypothetical protein
LPKRTQAAKPTEKAIPKRGHPGWQRYVIAGTGLAIVVARMVKPSIYFDDVSLWLFVLAALILLVPDIGDVLSRVRRIRKGDLQLELEGRIGELALETEIVEKKVGREQDLYTVVDMRDLRERIAGALRDPRGGLVTIAVEIEALLGDLAEQFGIAPRSRYMSPTGVVEELARRDLVPSELPPLFRDFWAVRNQAVHSIQYQPSSRHLYEILDLGIRILGLLSLRREPSEDN